MIRLPSTTILLGRSDLKEFERRRLRRMEVEFLNQEFSRFAVGGSSGFTFGSSQIQHTQEFAAEVDQHLESGDGQHANSHHRSLALPANRPQRAVGITSNLECDDYGAPTSPKLLSTAANDLPIIADLEEEHEYISVASENPPRDLQLVPSPSKHDFYYGGFVASPSEWDPGNASDRSPSSPPDDISTSQNIRLPDANRLRNRLPLPRSPLFLSQNASSSPEHRPTSGLTPRVESSVAFHNTPGIMFAQPARRMRRPAPRRFRHQTNSFSFDSSERASAAYEQERVTSISTNDSTPVPSDDRTLHEELRGSSLQSSRVVSGISQALPEPLGGDILTEHVAGGNEEGESTSREFIFSSPRLSLPPPFSATSRGASGVDYMPQNSQTSPTRSNSITPVRNGIEGGRPTPNSSSSGLQRVGGMDSSPPSAVGISPRSLLRRAGESMVELYRARTPLSRHGSLTHQSYSTSPSPTPRRGHSRLASSELGPRTPSRSYQVYNDALPHSSQPQTPANLPEAQHQSRFHPSYTAPVRRAGPGADRINSRDREIPSQDRARQLSTPLRRPAGRSASPIGMSRDGFAGLYGGRENGDEERNWAEGVRFSYAETRLWGMRDARNDGQSLRETPEPEDWRVGRRA